MLELGAGAGLPGIVSAIKGASTVVVTDYPDPDLIENIAHNVDTCDEIMNKSQVIAAVRFIILRIRCVIATNYPSGSSLGSPCRRSLNTAT